MKCFDLYEITWSDKWQPCLPVADVQQEGYKLPDSFEWSSCDMVGSCTSCEFSVPIA